MKKIELEIVALSSSISQTHSYAVVLGEVDGMRRLPIVIGGYEAQAIAVALERIKPTRPLTHDLFSNFLYSFNIDLQEAIIYKLEEGIFYSKLICSNDKETIEIDSRTSDALALAVRMGCRVFTYENILDSAGLYMDQSGENIEAVKESSATVESGSSAAEPDMNANLKTMTLAELEDLLHKILEQEDYVQAIAVRDEIQKRKNKPPQG